MRRVMIDQGNAAEIMYPNLFKGLGLKPEDLSTYSSPLVSFEGKMVVLRGPDQTACSNWTGCG